MADKFDDDDLAAEEETEDAAVTLNYDIASYPSGFTLSGKAQMWADKDRQSKRVRDNGLSADGIKETGTAVLRLMPTNSNAF